MGDDRAGAAYLDLTLPIWDGMRYNPDHFPPQMSRYAAIEQDGWAASRVVLDSHLGTHLDAPCHFVPGGATVEELSLDDLIGEYQVVHLAPVGPGTVVGPDDLPAELSRRVLLATGWSVTQLASPDYFRACPVLAPDAARRLVAAGTRTVGIDGPTVDFDGQAHRLLLGAGCTIVENLTNLTLLGTAAEVTILPLPLRGGDGSPVRAVARMPALMPGVMPGHDRDQ